MARQGIGFFDRKGQFFKTPEEATVSDLAAMLGKIGDGEGESLAPGIAFMLLEKRSEIERIFSEHDEMSGSDDPSAAVSSWEKTDNVAILPGRQDSEVEQAS